MPQPSRTAGAEPGEHSATAQGTLVGRFAVLLAVLLQAGGQVAYGTYLMALPSPLFVFGSFLFASAFFLTVSGRGARLPAWRPLVLLNAATALTFLSFFYALKVIEPAIASAINVGIGPLAAVVIALASAGLQPTKRRLVVCLGVIVGCAILAASAAQGVGERDISDASAWSGILASVATGCGAVLITVASKALLNRGWTSGAVLAHRFYLILPVSLGLALATSDVFAIGWSTRLIVSTGAIAALGVVAPLYLLQVGIRRTDPYTVMVTMAAMPIITFILQGFSPAYAWTWPTALGLMIVGAFILGDLATGRSGLRQTATERQQS